MAVFIIYFAYRSNDEAGGDDSNNYLSQKLQSTKTPYLVYYGDKLNFTYAALETILTALCLM